MADPCVSCTKSVNEGRIHQLGRTLDITIPGMMAAKETWMLRASEIMKSVSTGSELHSTSLKLPAEAFYKVNVMDVFRAHSSIVKAQVG